MTRNSSNRTNIKIVFLVVAAFLVACDQIIKYFVYAYLKPVGSTPVIPGVLQLSYYENDGAMMGMMGGKTLLMTLLAAVCIGGILFVILSGKLQSLFELSCITLMLAGGLGNIIDRIFRGFVIDYIEVLFVDFYIFNFADCLVTCGAAAVLIFEFYQMFQGKKKEKAVND
ncbi:MAG: signal peptidase II [Oscillospiraceae bacterium]|nr:signal peptidase II [Oscillospiraceae bacterium]